MKSFFVPLLGLSLAASAGAVGIKHDLGTVDLPNTPRRVVVLEYAYADDVSALGLKPVGWAREADVPDYLGRQLAGVPNVGTRAQPSLEKILALKPDLILADTGQHKNIYAQLSRIAPTISLNVFRSDYQGQLGALSTLGRALGREPQAQRLLDEQARLLTKSRLLARRGAGGLLVAALPPSNLFVLHSRESVIGDLMGRLGRTNLSSSVGKQDSLYSLDLEGIAALDPATLVLLVNPGEHNVLDSWGKNRIWLRLRAVQSGKVFTFDRDLWSKARGIQALGQITRQAVGSGLLQDRPKR
ncbi:ABC transporter substrate-binding protein [Deinococcus sp. Leaf326]|uniref:ABC transporter substrate-binding protein n=1 Tax=Deinococcus sp. Leaf326 TaxID=1736338 RepID=UPI0006F861C8|nr:ABC transporter substrate-binding protein [Deinococcus sp. Leaf326]KQR36193.1 hypothetical protein ASF71_15140 [Deinococcus sp. Leaf326]